MVKKSGINEGDERSRRGRRRRREGTIKEN